MKTQTRRILPFLILALILIGAIRLPPVLAQVTVGSTTTASALPFESTSLWYVKGLHWDFYSDGTNLVYKTSPDGVTWTTGSSSPIRTGVTSNTYAVTMDTNYIVYNVQPGGAGQGVYRRGTPGTDGSITWLAAEVATSGCSNLVDFSPSIVLDSGEHAWIGGGGCITPGADFGVVENTDITGGWTTGPSALVPAIQSNCNYGGFIIPLTNGKIIAFGFTNGNCGGAAAWFSATFDGTSFGAVQNLGISGTCCFTVSAVNDGDDVKFVAEDSATSNLITLTRTFATGTWSGTTTIAAALGAVGEVMKRTDNHDLYVFYVTGASIKYYSNIGGSWSGSATTLVTEGGSITTPLRVAYTSYSISGNIVFPMTYLTGAGPYNVRFDTFTIILAVPPSAPLNLAATASGSNIVLTWQTPSSNGGAPITNYKLYRSTSSGTETLYQTLGVVLTFTDSSVSPGTTYYYKVSAVNSAGEGAQSNEASAILNIIVSDAAPDQYSHTTGSSLLVQGHVYAQGTTTPPSATTTAYLSDGVTILAQGTVSGSDGSFLLSYIEFRAGNILYTVYAVGLSTTAQNVSFTILWSAPGGPNGGCTGSSCNPLPSNNTNTNNQPTGNQNFLVAGFAVFVVYVGTPLGALSIVILGTIAGYGAYRFHGRRRKRKTTAQRKVTPVKTTAERKTAPISKSTRKNSSKLSKTMRNFNKRLKGRV